METLKKISLIATFTFMFGSLMAQNTATTQAAFVKSYESEKAGNYTAAINSLKTVNKADKPTTSKY